MMSGKSWHLVDAEQIAKGAKYTFYKPSKAVYEKLRRGSLVKLIFAFNTDDEDAPRAERMWVKITQRDNDRFKGKLNNDPFYIKDLKYKEIIEFEEKHIIDTDIDDPEDNIVEKYIHRCLVTKKVLYEGQKIEYLYREESQGELKDGIFDSGWRIFAGIETQEYLDDANNSQFVSLGAILSQDDSIIDLLDAPIGTEFEWNEEKQIFEKIENHESESDL